MDNFQDYEHQVGGWHNGSASHILKDSKGHILKPIKLNANPTYETPTKEKDFPFKEKSETENNTHELVPVCRDERQFYERVKNSTHPDDISLLPLMPRFYGSVDVDENGKRGRPPQGKPVHPKPRGTPSQEQQPSKTRGGDPVTESQPSKTRGGDPVTGTASHPKPEEETPSQEQPAIQNPRRRPPHRNSQPSKTRGGDPVTGTASHQNRGGDPLTGTASFDHMRGAERSSLE
nr:acidic proline-rich protein PRP25-like [Penaeus vannamei]